jgi:hypothetical protein
MSFPNSRYKPLRFGSSLAAWYSARDPANSGAIPADGAALPAYNDQSTNANNLVQATGANQPLYKLNILNGHPMILFNGSTNRLVGTVISATTYSITTIVKSLTNAASPTQTIVYNGTTHTNGFGIIYEANRDILHGGVAYKIDSANPIAFEIITITWDGSTSTLRVNGVAQTITNAASGLVAATGNLLVGSDELSAMFFNGYIGDIIIRKSYSSAAVSADEHFISTINGLAI